MQHTQGTYNKGKKISNNKKGIYIMLKGQIKAKELEIKRLKSELDAKRKELLQMEDENRIHDRPIMDSYKNLKNGGPWVFDENLIPSKEI